MEGAPQFKYFDASARPVGVEAHPVFLAVTQQYAEGRQLWEGIVDRYGMEKPEWFMQHEGAARRFMASIGLGFDAPVHLLSEGDYSSVGLGDPGIIGQYDWITQAVYVRLDRILSHGSPEGTAGLLVHELTHATKPSPAEIAIQLVGSPETDDFTYRFRSGFTAVAGDRRYHSFLTEASAEFAAGLFYRRHQNPEAPFLSVQAPPRILLPPHYPQSHDKQVAGPDGYTLELLAYGLQEAGLADGSEFLEETLHMQAQPYDAARYRQFARLLHGLQPGLYKYLMELDYSRDNWQLALRRVYEVVR